MKRYTKLLSRVVFLGLVVAMVAGLSVAGQTMTAASMPAATNQAVVETYFGEVLSNADMTVADAILAPEFQRIDRSQFGAKLGAPGTKFLAGYQHSAFPDLRYTIDALVLVGDQAAVCWTARGTLAGEYGAAAATGKPVVWTGMSFIQVHDGKITAEMTNLENLSELLGAQELRISPSYAQ